MDKVTSSVVVLLTVFIAASIAIAVVFGQTDMLGGYSDNAQNSSICQSLAEQSSSQGDEAAERYQDQGCQTIYGNIQYTSQVEENSELSEGVTLNNWQQYVHYDTKDTFSFTIDYAELDGSEYIQELEPSFDSGNNQFVFDEDYEYAVDFYFTHPNEGNPSWPASNSWVYGDRQPIGCEGNVCDYKRNFTFAEVNGGGNLSNNLLPCQDTSGDVSDFVQKIAIRAWDTSGDRVGWVIVEEHNMGLVDWSGTRCWQEDSLPVFRDGEVVVKSMNISTSMNIDTDYRYNLVLDYGQSDKDINSLALTAAFPNGTADPSSSEYGKRAFAWGLDEVDNCGNTCEMSFEINLKDDHQVPPCFETNREVQDIPYNTTKFWIRERTDSGSDYLLLEEPNVTGTLSFGGFGGFDSQYSTTEYEVKCWQ